MRPLAKGAPPTDAKGNAVVFHQYQDARGELIRRLGEYCSYCEMHCDADLAVEHQFPKALPKYADLALDWSNFLLACRNCNSTKQRKDAAVGDPLWPDNHNTFHALVYGPGALVAIRSGLPADAEQRTQDLLNLVEVHLDPGFDPQLKDRRWMNRHEAWDIAQDMRHDLIDCNTPQMRRAILQNVKSKGYWSIWMTVFRNDPQMRTDLLTVLPGTCLDCFEANGRCRESIERH